MAMKPPFFIRLIPVLVALAAILNLTYPAVAGHPVEADMGMPQILQKTAVTHPYDAQLKDLVGYTMGFGTPWGKYRDPDDGRRYVGHSTCRPCHYNRNNTWIDTKMATAVKKLADFKGGIFLNDSRCLSCHTTGFDPGRDNGGFDDGVQWMAGVQCEACHGAGSMMVENMDRRFITRATDSDLCGRCHSERYGVGLCFPEYDEWKVSRHRRSLETLRNDPSAKDECLECHSVDAIVPPAGRPLSMDEALFGVTCQACHDAMVRTFPDLVDNNQLRLPKMELCRWCHSERKKTPGGLPHSPQAEMFSGTGGEEFPGEVYSSGPMNADIERGCLTCHALSDRSVFPPYQGHTFLPSILACRRCHPDIDGFNRKNVQERTRKLLLKVERAIKEYPPEKREGEAYRRALYNYNFVLRDRSLGIHNTDYTRKLLVDSLRFISRDIPSAGE